MLNSASDYKFVDTSYLASKIHGNIIPQWDATASTIPVYLENYLFLLEAFNERMNPEQAGSNSIAPDIALSGRNIYLLNLNSMSLSVSNGAIAGPYIGYDSDATYYVNPNTTCSNYHVATGNTEDSNYHIYDFLQNWYNPLPENNAPYYAMRPYYNPSRLLSEFMKVKFWTFDHMTKMLYGMRLGDFATKIVHQTLRPDGSVSQEYEVTLRNYVMSYLRGYGTTSDGHGGTTKYLQFNTVATYKQAFFTFPYASNAVLIWKCGIDSGSSEERKYVWGAKTLAITNGALEIPSDLFNTLADEACNASGKPITSTVDLYQCWLLVGFEFPARLDGVDWSWQPTYT